MAAARGSCGRARVGSSGAGMPSASQGVRLLACSGCLACKLWSGQERSGRMHATWNLRAAVHEMVAQTPERDALAYAEEQPTALRSSQRRRHSLMLQGLLMQGISLCSCHMQRCLRPCRRSGSGSLRWAAHLKELQGEAKVDGVAWTGGSTPLREPTTSSPVVSLAHKLG